MQIRKKISSHGLHPMRMRCQGQIVGACMHVCIHVCMAGMQSGWLDILVAGGLSEFTLGNSAAKRFN